MTTTMQHNGRSIDVIRTTDRGIQLDSDSVPRLDIGIAISMCSNRRSTDSKLGRVWILHGVSQTIALLPFQILEGGRDFCSWVSNLAGNGGNQRRGLT